MKSLFPGAAAAIATLCLAEPAQAAGSYPSPIFANVTIANCANGYLKPQGLSPATCVTAIPGVDLAAGAAVANLGFTPIGPSDTGTSGHKIPYLDGVNTWSGSQSFTARATIRSAGSPILTFEDTAAAADQKLWDIYAPSGGFVIRALNDAYSAANTAFACFRGSGYTVSSCAIGPSIFGLPASGYLNFGGATGPSGYGIRDTAGIIELKKNGGGWYTLLSEEYLGASGHKLPYLDGVNTWSGATQLFNNANFWVRPGADQNLLVRGPINLSDGVSIYSVDNANSMVKKMELAASRFRFSGGNVHLAAPYLNFDDTDGDPGYGLLNDAGKIKVKDSGGAWKHVATESLTTAGDANYTILATDDHVYHSALTAARTDTLPAANSVKAGHAIRVQDVLGVASATKTITVQRSGSDTINGAASAVAVNSAYGATTFVSDGVSKWSYAPPPPAAPSAATTADVQAGSDSSKYVTSSALSGSAAPQTLTDNATISWNMGLGYNAKITLGGNRTIATPTNFVVGQTYTLWVYQDATGSRTLTWPSGFDWGAAGAPTLSTTPGKMDLVTLVCISSTPTFATSITRGY